MGTDPSTSSDREAAGPCPWESTIRRLLDLGLDPLEHGMAAEHLDHCDECRVLLDRQGPVETAEPDPVPDAAFLRRLMEAPPPGAPADLDETPRSGIAGRIGPTGRALPRVPGYEVLSELGRGGMGVVYKAVQLRLNRTCALKMILGEHADDEAMLRFLAEAEMAARLRDPRIVQVYHIGEYEGGAFLELEFAEGGSLADRLDGIPWPPREAAAMVEGLALAMEAAHRAGIVHRDLKPSNILMTADGPKVADFGLARSLASDTGLTRTDTVLGSPGYMAPEQAQGKSRSAGPAVDVHALGAILYELLVGRPPFRGATVIETLDQVRTVEPVSPSRLVPGLPRDMVTIVLKCLQKDPARRYASGGALAEDLRRFLDGRPIVGRRAGAAERAWRWCRRRPALAASLGLAASAIVGVAVVSLSANVSLRAKQADLNRALRGAEAERSRAQALVAELAFDRAAASGEAGLGGAALAWMAEAASQLPADEPRLESLIRANLAAWGRAQPALRHVFEHGAAVQAAAVSPDGRTLLTGSDDGLARRWDPVDGTPIGEPFRHAFAIASVALSPDGRLALTTNRLLADDPVLREREFASLWDLSRGECRGRIATGPGLFVVGAFRPDGRAVAIGTSARGGRLGIWDVDSLRPLAPPLEFTPSGATSLGFSPDGTRLAVVVAESRRVVAADDLAKVLGVQGGQKAGIAFSPDGRSVLVGGNEKSARVWSDDLKQPKGEPWPHPDTLTSLAFSPDGQLALTGCRDGTARLWEVASGRTLGAPMLHAGAVRAVQFTPDGLAAVTAGDDGTCRVWDLAGVLDPDQVVLPHGSRVATMAVSPDGRRLFTGTIEGAGRLWDAETGRPVGPPLPHAGPVLAAAFRADGRVLLTGGGERNLMATARLWDAETGRPLGPVLRHDGYVAAAAFSPDGALAATACFDRTVRLWDATRGGTPALAPIRGQGMFTDVRFLPDGRSILAGHEDGTVRRWDVATGAEIGQPMRHGHHVSSVNISPDGRVAIVTAWDGRLRFWEVATGRLISDAVPQVSDRLHAVAFSPDGRTALVGSLPDGTARFLEVGTAAQVGEALPHRSRVVGVAIAPDGHRALTVCGSGTMWTWDIPSRRPLGPGTWAGQGIESATFTADGSRILAACRDGTARILATPAPDRAPLAEAPARAELLSGLSLTSGRQVVPLDRDGRSRLSRRSEAVDGPAALASLRDARANIALAHGDGFAATWQLGRPDQRPDDPWTASRRIRGLALLGRTAEAETEAARLLAAPDPTAFRDALSHDAADFEQSRRWETALWYLDRLIAPDTPDGLLLMRRARVRTALGRAREATSDLDRAIACGLAVAELEDAAHHDAVRGLWGPSASLLGPVSRSDDTPSTWRPRALAHLRAGDLAGYRSTCAELLTRIREQPDDPDRALAYGWIFALGPEAGDLTRAIARAEYAVAKGPGRDPETRHRALTTLGALLHRAGRHGEAASRLEEGLALSDGRPTIADAAFLVLSHRHLGHPDRARDLLLKARAIPAPRINYAFDWNRVEHDILLAEADRDALPQGR